MNSCRLRGTSFSYLMPCLRITRAARHVSRVYLTGFTSSCSFWSCSSVSNVSPSWFRVSCTSEKRPINILTPIKCSATRQCKQNQGIIPNGHRARPVFGPRLAGMDWPMRLNAAPCCRPRLARSDRLPLSAAPSPAAAMETGRLDSVRLRLLPDNRPNGGPFCRIE